VVRNVLHDDRIVAYLKEDKVFLVSYDGPFVGLQLDIHLVQITLNFLIGFNLGRVVVANHISFYKPHFAQVYLFSHLTSTYMY
jgi:hypothetical protein